MLRFRDPVPTRSPPIATRLLVLINALVFLFELTLSPPELEGLFHVFGIVPARFTHPDWAVSAGRPPHWDWPVFTHLFPLGGGGGVLRDIRSLLAPVSHSGALCCALPRLP